MRLRHIILFLLMAVFVTPIRASIHTGYLLGGRLTLKNGRIDKYQFDEGYCQAEKYPYNTLQDDFTFCYYDKDHLGNIRQVKEVDGTKEGWLLQTMDYYPFGAQFCDGTTDSNVQSHKYNGKELDLMHGLNTYDYGARQYNPVTARWDRVDPLAEKFRGTSPYVYCDNNSVKYIDKEGKEKKEYLTTDEVQNSDYSLYPENTPGVLNIWAHGVYKALHDEFALGINVGRFGDIDNAQDFHDAILKYSSEWKETGGENITIVLHACGTSDFARKLSQDKMFKGRNITIVAPNAKLRVSPKGSKVNGKIFFQPGTNWEKRIKTEDGKWMAYKDGELVGTESSTAQPGRANKK